MQAFSVPLHGEAKPQAGTRIYRQTASVELTARMLGHQQLETSRIYAKLSDTQLERALDEW